MLIQRSVQDHIATITLNRPESLNALSQQLIAEFRDSLAELGGRDDIRALMVTGAGRAFCAGSDIKELFEIDVDTARKFQQNEASLCEELETFPFPTIGAIHGYAMGGGFALALCHDFRIAAESTTFGAPEVKLGWNPPFGIAQAVRLLGETVAKDLLMTGRSITADEARQLGVVTRVVPDDEPIRVAQEIAATLRDLPVEAVTACKREINRVARQNRGCVRPEEMEAFLRCFETREAQQAIRGFVEKRRGQ
jgi:enoyl-CoA hydratase